MQQILTERHSDKSKQITNWSVSTFKGKLKFFRFKIVKYKPRAFNRNSHFRYCFMYNSTGYVIKQLIHAFCCALSSYGALGKFGEHSRS